MINITSLHVTSIVWSCWQHQADLSTCYSTGFIKHFCIFMRHIIHCSCFSDPIIPSMYQCIKLLTVDYVSNINFCHHFALCTKILHQWTFKIICEWLCFSIIITLILSTILLLLRPEFACWNGFPAILLILYSHTINYFCSWFDYLSSESICVYFVVGGSIIAACSGSSNESSRMSAKWIKRYRENY